MAKHTNLDTSAGTFTAATNSTFIADLLAGAQAPFLAKGEALDAESSRYAALVYGVGGLIVGSVVARKRMAAGDQPIMKVFF